MFTRLARTGPRPITGILSPRRVLLASAGGAVAAAAAVTLTHVIAVFPLVFWNVSAGTLMVLVWLEAWPKDAAYTKYIAEREGGRSSTDSVVLTATVASVAAVAFGLVHSSSRADPTSTAIVVLTPTAALISWGVVNTVFALKYARLYYYEQDGGIDFKQVDPPAYVDFAYLAFTIGVSFAVSETEPRSTAARRIALFHALLSYGFTTLIITVAVNLVTNL